MSDLRAFVHGMLPLLSIAPGDDTKVELGISFFWIHSGMLSYDILFCNNF
jgi:hypothetical protein